VRSGVFREPARGFHRFRALSSRRSVELGYRALPEAKRNDACLLISVPIAVRRQVEELAYSERVSLSTIGRRAVVWYLGSREPAQVPADRDCNSVGRP